MIANVAVLQILFAVAFCSQIPLKYEKTMVPVEKIDPNFTSPRWFFPSAALCAIVAAQRKAASFTYQEYMCEAIEYDRSNWTDGASTTEVMSFKGDLTDLEEGITGYKPTTPPPTSSTAITTTTSSEDESDDSSTGECPASFSLSPVGCIAISTKSVTAWSRDSVCKDMGGSASAYVERYSEFEQLVQWLADQGAPSSQLHVGATCWSVSRCGWLKNLKTIDADYFPSGEPKEKSGPLITLALNMDPSDSYYMKLSSIDTSVSLRSVCIA